VKEMAGILLLRLRRTAVIMRLAHFISVKMINENEFSGYIYI